jgi:hypothetical protein
MLLRWGTPSKRRLIPNVATSTAAKSPREKKMIEAIGTPFLKSPKAIAPNPAAMSAGQILRGTNSKTPTKSGVAGQNEAT